PGTEYRPPRAAPAAHSGTLPPGGAVVFPSGALAEEQLLALFTVFPVDVTFVDAEDRVAFFSEGPDRVFARSRSIIGRTVQNCHPPSSVHIVERILSDFRSGAQDVAEFWIDLHGRFVHIRYFAVRDPEGKYLGTLEVTQDATRIRSLEGERRLLQYENAQPRGGDR
ncbi:MAG: PAS domain-containing protein, partial [Candidatus Eisenbacteria bacterium]